jgi:hypothetical protein
MSKKLSYLKACEKINSNGCKPLFTENEWSGVVVIENNKKVKQKYWFQDISGHPFYTTYDNVASGHSKQCKECAMNSQKKLQKLSEIEFDKYVEMFKNEKDILVITPYKEYTNNKQKLKCICLICNIEFKDSIAKLYLKDSHGCINISKGERIAITMFEQQGIDYKYQVYNHELNLTSDFEILLENGSKIHLEIDGDQHYIYPNEFHRTKEDFLNAQQRDMKKDDWYSNLNQNNLHIRYNVQGKFNDDIMFILQSVIDGDYGICKRKKKNINFSAIDLKNYNYKNKKIIAYTLDGNFFGIYESALEAQKILGVDNSCISECLYNKRNMQRAESYIFKLYEEYYPLTIPPYKNPLSKPVLLFKNGSLIDEVKSLNELERVYNFSKSSICRYLNGKGKNPYIDDYDFQYKVL